MKIDHYKDNLIVFLNKLYVKDININDKDSLEEYFKNIFRKLKNYYNININGYYIVEVFKDKKYGVIIKLEKEEIDYYDYFTNQVDMRIMLSKYDKFLYEPDKYEILNELIIKKCDIYEYRKKIYLYPKEEDDIFIGKLLETTKIIYGGLTEIITKYGKKIDIY